jgi:Flp pilus assembly protein CpaB
LALTPIQTETLALAEEAGEIRLALRADRDQATTRLGGVNLDQVTGVRHYSPPNISVSGKLPLPLKPNGPQVEFIQGTEKTLYNF